MIKFFVMQIKLGKKKLEDIPEKYRSEVEKLLLNEQYATEENK